MLARRALAAILTAVASLEAPLALAETRSHLEGDVRPAGAFVEAATWESLFNAPGAPIATEAHATQVEPGPTRRQ